MNTPHIYGLGTVVIDHQVIMETLPEPDTKGEISEDRFQVGGPVPTALCLLRRFGCPVTFQGVWAGDRFGKMIEEDLTAEDVAYETPPPRPDSKTGFAHVWVERATGRRSIAAHRGSHQIEASEIRSEALQGVAALHLDGWSTLAAVKAAQIVRTNGGRVFMDLGSPKPHLGELLGNVDWLNCPLRLIQQLFETADPECGARELMGMGPTRVTITDGGNGASLFTSDGASIHEPALSVAAVDTNGAGDTFAGACLFASLQNWTPERSLRFAVTAAALKCRTLGNRAALPTLRQIETFSAG
ncbi:MAG: sugar/nucleoside kinase (ribokinase family) [Limisphaerales bacterium]|jgi:sugar/nucleoside kinase (ribokinase family)